MKKFLLLMSIILMGFVFVPKTYAAELYGLTLEETTWQDKPNGGKYFTQTYYVTSTTKGYVYLNLLEVNNVQVDMSNIGAAVGSSFDLVYASRTNITDNNGTVSAVELLFKVKDGVTLNGKTELFTVAADILDPSKKECSLAHSPLTFNNCMVVGNHYFNDEWVEVSEEEYHKVCDNVTPTTPPDDVPDNAQTGSVVPYIAIGLGIVAIGALYLYSKKSNKMFKI